MHSVCSSSHLRLGRLAPKALLLIAAIFGGNDPIARRLGCGVWGARVANSAAPAAQDVVCTLGNFRPGQTQAQQDEQPWIVNSNVTQLATRISRTNVTQHTTWISHTNVTQILTSRPACRKHEDLFLREARHHQRLLLPIPRSIIRGRGVESNGRNDREGQPARPAARAC